MAALSGQVAVVAGATRGAGRGIACMLGEAGATVYCTGRSTRAQPAASGRSETIEETAEMVSAHGGVGLWAQVDHTQPAQVQALFERVAREQGSRLDVLVNDLSGDGHLLVDGRMPCAGNPVSGWQPFWAAPLERGLLAQRVSVHAHLITSQFAARLMVERRRGLIVEVTDGHHVGYNDCGVFYSLTKASAVLLAYYMAQELRPYNVAALALTPGDMLSEIRLAQDGLDQSAWKASRLSDPGLAEAESPFYVGRAVAALAAAPNIMEKSGRALSAGQLAREFGFTDVNGRQPLSYPGEGVYLENWHFQVRAK